MQKCRREYAHKTALQSYMLCCGITAFATLQAPFGHSMAATMK